MTIEKTINDKFSGWTIGDLQILDDFDEFFNGNRRAFSLKLAGENVSILASPGSNVNVEHTLLIFINDILQVPGESYRFNGGNILTFTEAPKEGDTSKVIFYRGSGDIDVIEREVLDTVKVGDTLTINHSPTLGQSETLQEDPRLVTRIDSVDVVSTNPYYGPGNIDNPDLLRPVTWCRQTEDVFVDSKIVGKSRELYEANINPSAYLIKSVGIGETIIFVDNVRPFFDPTNETNAGGSDPFAFQRDIVLISQDSKVAASATAIVSVAGTISSIVLSDGGVGYTTTPTVSIAGIGVGATVTAEASATISGGSIVSIDIINSGLGYTTSNSPVVLIESPQVIKESDSVESYSGDSGIIVGFGTTTISGNNQFIFDLFIPIDSYLRDSKVSSSTTTISSLSSGDYFMVYESNVGVASTSISSLDNSYNIVAIGTSFVDNVYYVDSVEVIERVIVAPGLGGTTGVGTTSILRVFAPISGISTITFDSTNITMDSGIYTMDITSTETYSGTISTTSISNPVSFGKFSWGKISLGSRSNPNEFNFYGNNGISGITSSAVVFRQKPLRYNDYIL